MILRHLHKKKLLLILLSCALGIGMMFGVIFSSSGLTNQTTVDFSKQVFLCLDTKIAPNQADPVIKKISLLNHPDIVFKHDISYSYAAQNKKLLLTTTKEEFNPTLIFKTDFRQAENTVIVLEIKTSKIMGQLTSKIHHIQIAWTNTNKFIEEKSIVAQMLPNSTTYIFIGRQESQPLQNPALQLTILGVGYGTIMYEIDEINILEIDNRFKKEFFPSNLNYKGMRPIQ